jgi:hypothetical protein
MGASKELSNECDLERDVESCISFLLNASNGLEDSGALISKLERMLPRLKM